MLILIASTGLLPADPFAGPVSVAYLASAAALVSMGACVMTFNTLSTALVQQLCDDRMRGRVTSIFLLDIGIAPLGNTWAGLVASLPAVGAAGASALMGAITLAAMGGARSALRRL